MSLFSNRRHLLMAGAGVGAAALGLGLALRHNREPAVASAQTEALWSARFDRPEGGELIAADYRGKPLLLNFWATWCAPCVKELPELGQFQREFAAQGWQVVGLAVDAPTPVREFLQKIPLEFPVGMAGLIGTDLARTLGNAQGGLPFSVAFAANGEILWRKLGATTLEELRKLGQAKA